MDGLSLKCLGVSSVSGVISVRIHTGSLIVIHCSYTMGGGYDRANGGMRCVTISGIGSWISCQAGREMLGTHLRHQVSCRNKSAHGDGRAIYVSRLTETISTNKRVLSIDYPATQ